MTAPVQAGVVKLLLPPNAHGHVSYLAALVACFTGGLVSAGFVAASPSGEPSMLGGGAGAGLLPALFGATSVLAIVVSVGVKCVIVWGSATADGRGRSAGHPTEEPWA